MIHVDSSAAATGARPGRTRGYTLIEVLAALIIVTYIPWISLVLPSALH